MSFVIEPLVAVPDTPVSLPNYCSFVASDDGSGGQVLINGQGVVNAVVTGAVDLKTFFTGLGLPFRSYALLRAFRAIYTGSALQQAACDQFLANLEVVITPIGGSGIAAMPSLTYIVGAGSGPANAPYLVLVGPSVSGRWRIDLRLRHSTTN